MQLKYFFLLFSMKKLSIWYESLLLLYWQVNLTTRLESQTLCTFSNNVSAMVETPTCHLSFYLHLSGTFIFHSQWPQLFPTQFFSFKTKQNTLQIDKWIQLKCRILKIFLHKNISLKTNSPNCLFQKWFLWNNW